MKLRPSPDTSQRRTLELSKAFTLIKPGPVVLVTTHDGRKLDRQIMMASKLPPGA